MSNFTERCGAGPVTMRFLNLSPSSKGRTVVIGFCSQLLPHSHPPALPPAPGLCTSPGVKTSLCNPLLLWLELGELEAVLALGSDNSEVFFNYHYHTLS